MIYMQTSMDIFFYEICANIYTKKIEIMNKFIQYLVFPMLLNQFYFRFREIKI